MLKSIILTLLNILGERAIMRHKRVRQVLRVIKEMSAKPEYDGVTIKRIMIICDCSRATADRILQVIKAEFDEAGSLICESLEKGQKGWRLQALQPLNLANVKPSQVAELEEIAGFLDKTSHRGMSESLRDLAANLAVFIDRKAGLSVRIEELLAVEGLVQHVGPKIRLNPLHLQILRHAILHHHVVVLSYISRNEGRPRLSKLDPVGFLWGSRHYLVGRSHNTGQYHTYSLPDIDDVIESTEKFTSDPEFSLKKFSAKSFGVKNNETLMKVVLRFSPYSARDAAQFNFHSTQSKPEIDNEGRLIISFSACGELELCRHIFTWGEGVEILNPPELKQAYRRMLKACLDVCSGL